MLVEWRTQARQSNAYLDTGHGRQIDVACEVNPVNSSRSDGNASEKGMRSEGGSVGFATHGASSLQRHKKTGSKPGVGAIHVEMQGMAVVRTKSKPTQTCPHARTALYDTEHTPVGEASGSADKPVIFSGSHSFGKVLVE